MTSTLHSGRCGRTTFHNLFCSRMETERWFKVLVLGGAMLGGACAPAQEARGTRRSTGGTGGSAGGSGGATVLGGGAPASTGSTAGSSGVSSTGAGDAGGGSAAGGAGDAGGGTAAGGARPGAGGDGSHGPSSGDGGAGGSGGSGAPGGIGGQLQCRIDASGHGDPGDPCGCPCCWAKDCLNTDAPCCAGFCKNADHGRGCCAQ